MSQPRDPMADIRASFFVECEELLESLQDALATMDEGLHDNETINVVFRAVHSIKGGAGAFGLTALVAFAHRYETVMDEVRSGRMEVTPEATKLFFQAADLLQDHVRAARDDGPEPAGSEDVLHDLEELMGGPPPVEEVEDAPTSSRWAWPSIWAWATFRASNRRTPADNAGSATRSVRRGGRACTPHPFQAAGRAVHLWK